MSKIKSWPTARAIESPAPDSSVLFDPCGALAAVIAEASAARAARDPLSALVEAQHNAWLSFGETSKCFWICF